LVQTRLPPVGTTHIDRGKAVHGVLLEVLEKLRPEAGCPANPIPRQWYSYLILHGAYLEEKLNREIMSQLYISEGTFNRTRRLAIHTIARALEEMEASIN